MTGLALGCSHTAGAGIDASECYISLLSNQLGVPIINTGLSGGNADYCLEQLTKHLRQTHIDFVIAQWPNPIRKTIWVNGAPCNENIHNASGVFRAILTAGTENFVKPWLQSIVTADTLCKLANIPVVHILLEDLDDEHVQYLDKNNIILHRDLKQPDTTWLFDSAGSDNLHHSAKCHAQWTTRLHGLLNELTTP
jgi:hypothetical protein